MKQRAFKQVDVFGQRPYAGNPLAVVLDGEGLSSEEMQHFANWTNLSETTFLLPPTTSEADYRIRIFTATSELPFAGHPTLGSCHAWLQAGGQPKHHSVVVQECKVGLVNVRRDNERLAFAAPPLVRSGPVDDDTLQNISRALQVPTSSFTTHQWVDNGPGWVAVMLRSAEEVLNVIPDYSAMKGLKIGIVGAYSAGSECHVEVRTLFGTIEDPVTGSLNAGLGQWLIGSGLMPERYVASQGTVLGRTGRVYLERDETGQVWVGGDTVTCIEGIVQV
jgi:PhzF family phenazine biosynthesis protein